MSLYKAHINMILVNTSVPYVEHEHFAYHEVVNAETGKTEKFAKAWFVEIPRPDPIVISRADIDTLDEECRNLLDTCVKKSEELASRQPMKLLNFTNPNAGQSTNPADASVSAPSQ